MRLTSDSVREEKEFLKYIPSRRRYNKYRRSGRSMRPYKCTKLIRK